MLDIKNWKGNQSQTIEHIAPQREVVRRLVSINVFEDTKN